MELSGSSRMDILKNTGIFGYGSNDQKNISADNLTNINKQKLQTVRKGVIASLNSSNSVLDYSGGATSWQGRDFKGNTSANAGYYKVGFQFSHPSHDIFGMGSFKHAPYKFGYTINGTTVNLSTPYKYVSTAAYGKTVFMRLDAGYIFSQYPQISQLYFTGQQDEANKKYLKIAGSSKLY